MPEPVPHICTPDTVFFVMNSLVEYALSEGEEDPGELEPPPKRRHYVVRLCTAPGCTTQAVHVSKGLPAAFGQFCRKHHDRCAHEGCNRALQLTGHQKCRPADPGKDRMCPAHGGRGRCRQCTRVAKKGGLCVAHGSQCLICYGPPVQGRKCCSACVGKLVENYHLGDAAGACPPERWGPGLLGAWVIGAGGSPGLVASLHGYTAERFVGVDLKTILPHAVPLGPALDVQARFARLVAGETQ